MYVNVLVQLLLGVGGGQGKLVSLGFEVVSIALAARFQNRLVTWICFNIGQAAEQLLMILVHFLVENCKEGVPLERSWDGVDHREKASVREISILDVLG